MPGCLPLRFRCCAKATPLLRHAAAAYLIFAAFSFFMITIFLRYIRLSIFRQRCYATRVAITPCAALTRRYAMRRYAVMPLTLSISDAAACQGAQGHMRQLIRRHATPVFAD